MCVNEMLSDTQDVRGEEVADAIEQGMLSVQDRSGGGKKAGQAWRWLILACGAHHQNTSVSVPGSSRRGRDCGDLVGCGIQREHPGRNN